MLLGKGEAKEVSPGEIATFLGERLLDEGFFMRDRKEVEEEPVSRGV